MIERPESKKDRIKYLRAFFYDGLPYWRERPAEARERVVELCLHEDRGELVLVDPDTGCVAWIEWDDEHKGWFVYFSPDDDLVRSDGHTACFSTLDEAKLALLKDVPKRADAVIRKRVEVLYDDVRREFGFFDDILLEIDAKYGGRENRRRDLDALESKWWARGDFDLRYPESVSDDFDVQEAELLAEEHLRGEVVRERSRARNPRRAVETNSPLPYWLGAPRTAERARKIAQIDELKHDEETPMGRLRCDCMRGVFPSFRDSAPPTTMELRARAVYFVQFVDDHSEAEHTRRVRMAYLNADPNYDPPPREVVKEH